MSGFEMVSMTVEAGCEVVHQDSNHTVVAHLKLGVVLTIPNVKELAQELVEKIKQLLHLE